MKSNQFQSEKDGDRLFQKYAAFAKVDHVLAMTHSEYTALLEESYNRMQFYLKLCEEMKEKLCFMGREIKLHEQRR